MKRLAASGVPALTELGAGAPAAADQTEITNYNAARRIYWDEQKPVNQAQNFGEQGLGMATSAIWT